MDFIYESAAYSARTSRCSPGVPRRFQANVTHVDTVGRLPPGAVSLARSEQDEHQAIRFTPTCYGVQYHPEIDAEIMRGYIEGRRETLDAERFDVEALLDGVTEAEAGRRTMHNFLRHVVFRSRCTDPTFSIPWDVLGGPFLGATAWRPHVPGGTRMTPTGAARYPSGHRHRDQPSAGG
ncbi:glutamine amidotransferase-related protein [Chondromyces crocatus]|uniref:glutamine amidotransferase-related protein n=1 Tax=Chondromyces crocatus TaxID=52 RepID=UPI0012E31B4B|nr:hypothetical protein [Chondromyces crocatus]